MTMLIVLSNLVPVAIIPAREGFDPLRAATFTDSINNVPLQRSFLILPTAYLGEVTTTVRVSDIVSHH